MNKICINGVNFANFGENNYSCGMQLISTTAAITVEEVLSGKFPGVFLNPSAPWIYEKFCVLGTEEQYRKFYERQREAQISKRAVEEIPMGVPIHVYREMRDKFEEEYKDWWTGLIRKN